MDMAINEKLNFSMKTSNLILKKLVLLIRLKANGILSKIKKTDIYKNCVRWQQLKVLVHLQELKA